MIEKIVSGKMEKFYEENCLYEQHFIKDEGLTVKELVDQAIAKLGENIAIRRFSRFKSRRDGWICRRLLEQQPNRMRLALLRLRIAEVSERRSGGPAFAKDLALEIACGV